MNVESGINEPNYVRVGFQKEKSLQSQDPKNDVSPRPPVSSAHCKIRTKSFSRTGLNWDNATKKTQKPFESIQIKYFTKKTESLNFF